jgi:mannose-6-phosphate isomerase
MKQPIFLESVCKDYLWGGDRLHREFGKGAAGAIVAESWELACHPDGSCQVPLADHMPLPTYLQQQGVQQMLGTACADLTQLPLIKLIDARAPLSVQVHPDDAYAQHKGFPTGKTEMWYVVDAAPEASLLYGVQTPLTRAALRQHIEDGTLETVVRRVPAAAGDVFFIPPGTLHAIGGGMLIAEVQQNSNLTYRVYDYNRTDAQGNKRELHIEDALAVTHLQPEAAPVKPVCRHMPWGTLTVLTVCPYFAVQHAEITGAQTLCVTEKSFVHVLILEGTGVLRTGSGSHPLKKGDSVLLPAGMGNCCLDGKLHVLETYCPDAEE